MRREICAALVAAALLCAPGKADAAAGNGQLVAIRAGSLVTFNADGSGEHALPVSTAGPVSEPVWSPDGNRIAFINGNRVAVLDLATGTVNQLTSGAVDADPGWSNDGARVHFRRGSDLLSVPAGGGDATALGHAADASTSSLAWGSDGSIARVTTGGELAYDPLDGSGEVSVADGVQGRPAISPDASKLVIGADEGTFLDRLFLIDGDNDLAGVGGGGGNESEPAFSPDGAKVVYHWIQPLAARPDQLRIVDLASASDASIPFAAASRYSQPAWQPCVAGVTLSCTSVTPPAQLPFSCPASAPLTVAGGKSVPVPLGCVNAHNYMIVTPPAHGTAAATTNGGAYYHANSNYAGPDAFSVRVWGENLGLFALVTVNVTVTPKPAAPTPTVVGKPKLDRKGRVLLRLQCDRVCTASLRVSVKLTTGRVITGEVVKGAGAPGRALKLTLKRGAIPKHRKVASARVVGTLTGLDGLKRNVTIALR